MNSKVRIVGAAGAAIGATTLWWTGGLLAQSASSAPVRYEMRAGTTTGLAGMGSGMGAAMAAMFGRGGGQPQHELLLRLGSDRVPTGAPKADHFMPVGMKLGKSVPLVTPKAAPTPRETYAPGQFERPKGRMLIYWGCGEHAPKGQPVVIDFSKMAAGQVPPGLFTGSVPVDLLPTVANSRTFGQWPAEDGKRVATDSSLVGVHRVAGNYSPELAFTLANDFMGGLQARAADQPSGAVQLTWNALPNATGYHASLFGARSGPDGQNTDIVWWSSSATREFGGGLTDWLSPATVARLVANRTVMSPQTTSCTVPAEVKRDAPTMMVGSLYAWGPEENFAYPPRPVAAKAAWKPEWTARIRHRSSTSWLIGAPPGMAAAQSDENPAPAQCAPKKKKKGLGALGSMLGQVLVPGSGC